MLGLASTVVDKQAQRMRTLYAGCAVPPLPLPLAHPPTSPHHAAHVTPRAPPALLLLLPSYLGGGGGARRAVDGVEGTPLGVPPGLAGAAGARRAGCPDSEVRARPA